MSESEVLHRAEIWLETSTPPSPPLAYSADEHTVIWKKGGSDGMSLV